MDTHKKVHKVALHYPRQEEIVTFAVKNTAIEIKKMVKKVRRAAPGEVAFCYEAGVCGFTLKRRITRAGNKRVRRLLTEASWHYRHPCNVGKSLQQRREDQPQWVIDIADRAGQRLRKRYRRLINSGKMPCKAMIAVARELAGFIWSVFREYELRNSAKAV